MEISAYTHYDQTGEHTLSVFSLRDAHFDEIARYQGSTGSSGRTP